MVIIKGIDKETHNSIELACRAITVDNEDQDNEFDDPCQCYPVDPIQN